ncbi:MAG: NYN domain-containing protein [Magnetococcales bacterium]|nr:NYN domain-containing protein [Magnetococcales bacterium]NGZ25417.1 NYN domain-containing protein [Magnetococcales bacterium]
MKRAAVYIDGFNLYHALKILGLEEYKWLNIRALVENFLPSSQYESPNITYFSAYVHWIQESMARQKRYVAALQAVGVNPVLGTFARDKEYSCDACGNKARYYVEKTTDVHIGVSMMQDACKGHHDLLMLVSADSDFAPALHLIRKSFPSIELKVLVPPAQQGSKALRKEVGAKNVSHIKHIHVQRSLLAREYQVVGRNESIIRPYIYDPLPMSDDKRTKLQQVDAMFESVERKPRSD